MNENNNPNPTDLNNQPQNNSSNNEQLNNKKSNKKLLIIPIIIIIVLLGASKLMKNKDIGTETNNDIIYDENGDFLLEVEDIFIVASDITGVTGRIVRGSIKLDDALRQLRYSLVLRNKYNDMISKKKCIPKKVTFVTFFIIYHTIF